MKDDAGPLVMALAAALSAATAAPAQAHPFTGGPSTGPQIAITVVGAVMLAGGVVVMLKSTRAEGDAPKRGKRHRTGLVTVLVGADGVYRGPRSVAPRTTCVRPTTQAAVEIISPTEGQAVPGGQVGISVELTGGEIASVSSTANTPGEGHLHISVDGRLASMTGATNQTLDLPPGVRELSVEYVANDHAPFCVRVSDRVTFSVI